MSDKTKKLETTERVPASGAAIISCDDKLKQLIDLCDNYFVNVMIQPYSGANRECMYCGAVEQRDGSVHHSYVSCPIIKYQEIINSYMRASG